MTVQISAMLTQEDRITIANAIQTIQKRLPFLVDLVLDLVSKERSALRGRDAQRP